MKNMSNDLEFRKTLKSILDGLVSQDANLFNLNTNTNNRVDDIEKKISIIRSTLYCLCILFMAVLGTISIVLWVPK
jgi:hypothetical protein